MISARVWLNIDVDDFLPQFFLSQAKKYEVWIFSFFLPFFTPFALYFSFLFLIFFPKTLICIFLLVEEHQTLYNNIFFVCPYNLQITYIIEKYGYFNWRNKGAFLPPPPSINTNTLTTYQNYFSAFYCKNIFLPFI